MSEEKDIEHLIIRYFEKEISEDELRELDIWLELSPENKSLFFDLKNIHESNQHNRFIGKERCGWDFFNSRLCTTSAMPEKKSFPGTYLLTFLKYAAIICIAFSIGWIFKDYKKDLPQDIILEEVVYNRLQTEANGRIKTLTLSDGSKVILNAATTISYPAKFGDKREVFLDGEAYFDIAQDTLKPFIVKLKQQDITVMGTTFNVESYSQDAYSCLTLLSGRVLLEAYNGEGETMSHIYLKPNQEAYTHNETGSVTIQDVDTSFATAWIRGVYKFKDEPLSSILGRLEKYYGVKIHLKNDKLKSIRYTGTFSLSQTIQEVLSIINHNKEFVYKTINGEITISEKRMYNH